MEGQEMCWGRHVSNFLVAFEPPKRRHILEAGTSQCLLLLAGQDGGEESPWKLSSTKRKKDSQHQERDPGEEG
jgi:hypothetical protein